MAESGGMLVMVRGVLVLILVVGGLLVLVLNVGEVLVAAKELVNSCKLVVKNVFNIKCVFV